MSSSTKSTKKARSPSPAATPKAKSEKKPRASSAKKKKEEPVAAAASRSPTPQKKARETKKKEPKKPSTPIVDEEITSEESGESAIIIDITDAPYFVQDSLKDSTAVHNVIRIQYLQMYAIGFALLGSAFSPAIATIQLFAGTSGLIQAVVGALCLAQAFSLTAVAQTSFSPMKKTLQYNLVFHLLFAFAVILKQDAKLEGSHVQFLVGVSLFNIALNLWACYFRNNDLDIDDNGEEEAH